MKSVFFGFVLSANRSSAAPLRTTLGTVPHDAHPYVKGSSASFDQIHRVHVTFHPKDPVALEQLFWEVSTPGSERYGAFLTPVELRTLVEQPESKIAPVTEWFERLGASVVLAPMRDGLKVSFNASLADSLFECNLHTWEYRGVSKLRCGQPSFTIPTEFTPVVQGVEGLLDFPLRHGHGPVGLLAHSTIQNVLSVPDMCEVYNVPKGTSGSTASAGAVYGPGFHSDDIAQFEQHWSPNRTGQKAFLGGSAKEGQGDGEAMLDIEMMVGMGHGVKAYMFDSEYGMFGPVVDAAINNGAKPSVLSWSYGISADESYYKTIDTAMQKAGVSGISVFASSGDSGAVCAKGRLGETGFPNSSPYIVAVGGTTPARDGSGSWSETAWTNGGGGFSGLRAQPSFQAEAVSAWVANPDAVHPTPSSLYVTSQRATPDVSAVASAVHIVNQGSDETVGGTSVSSPVVAALVALLNDDLKKAGKNVLGFPNPLFYKHPEMFHDITSGNNWAGRSDGTCSGWDQGFPAARGWDPSTGLGTPNYQKMKEVVLSNSVMLV